jgi:hypothetical protein
MRRIAFCCLTLIGCLSVAHSVAVSEEPPMSQADLMKKWEEVKRLGPHHKALEYFLGTWDGVIEYANLGGHQMPPDKVVGTGAWLLEGRWMSFRVKGTMYGMPFEGVGIQGYDNVKKAHVSTWVADADTTLHYHQGTTVDPEGKVKSLYGTLDEWTTGEHDKPVRITTRKVSDDKFVQEIWDLGIGELGRVVMKWTYTRRKDAAPAGK